MKKVLEGHLVGFDAIPFNSDDQESYHMGFYKAEDGGYCYYRGYTSRNTKDSVDYHDTEEYKAILKQKRQEAADEIKQAKTQDEKFSIVKRFHSAYGWCDENATALAFSKKIRQLYKEDEEFEDALAEKDPYAGLLREEKFVQMGSGRRKFARLELLKYLKELKSFQAIYSKTAPNSPKREAISQFIANRQGLIQQRKDILLGKNDQRDAVADKIKEARAERDALKSALPTREFITKKRLHLIKTLKEKRLAAKVR